MVELGWAQFGRKSTVSKGPRALGLVQLTANGKARLTPVAVMVDGKFYDAGSYKADPVPMALDFGVVYEGFRTGVSQGLLTITQPGRLGHIWIAEGTWLPAGSKPASTRRKAEVPNIEEKDAPPRLHRGDAPASGGDRQKPAPSPAAAPATTPPPPVTAKAPPPVPETIEDPNRPVLRRGKPTAKAPEEPFTTFDAAPAPAKSAKGGGTIQFIPAISDAGGPDPRSYTYEVKPDEETTYRSRMLDLAATELRAQQGREKTAPAPPPPSGPATTRRKPASATPAPNPSFEDVRLRIFDLSSSNEPVLVLSARTRPVPGAGTGVAGPEQEITLIARTNIEGELLKMFFSATDAQHLYVAPRMELIDAVDADGDGRGELLFRRTFDAGSAYAIYRVAAGQLWPLFEGTP